MKNSSPSLRSDLLPIITLDKITFRAGKPNKPNIRRASYRALTSYMKYFSLKNAVDSSNGDADTALASVQGVISNFALDEDHVPNHVPIWEAILTYLNITSERPPPINDESELLPSVNQLVLNGFATNARKGEGTKKNKVHTHTRIL